MNKNNLEIKALTNLKKNLNKHHLYEVDSINQSSLHLLTQQNLQHQVQPLIRFLSLS